MTDKQIIIDGVDVADCEHINACDKKMKCVILQDDVCETNPYCEGFNCYYKQLKRKEQECERLEEEAIKRSKELIRIRKERQEGQKMNRNLHKQLDQLKADNNELKKLLKDGGLHNLSLMAEKRVLLQTLTEIKQLLEDALDTDKTNAEQSFDNIHKAIKLCEVLDE